MRSRWAEPEEQAVLQILWKLCFGDDETITDCFFSFYPPKRHTRVIELEGQIAAMASWLPVKLHMQTEVLQGAYVYAVATHPDFRGQGLCRSLMEELEQALQQQGMAFAALCPAEDSLYAFYGAMGYETAFYRSNDRVTPGESLIDATQISCEAYAALRESVLSLPHCEWDQTALGYLAATGVRFYRFSGGGCCAAHPIPEKGVRVIELLTENTPSAVTALCHSMDAQWAEVGKPLGEQPHGMLKWLIFGQKTDSFYLGFAFD